MPLLKNRSPWYVPLATPMRFAALPRGNPKFGPASRAKEQGVPLLPRLVQI